MKTESETPRNKALMRTKPPMWRQWQDADFCDLEELSKQLERELCEMRKALDELHVVIECAPGDIIHDWYCTDPLASQARDNALAILTRRYATLSNNHSTPPKAV